MSISGLSLAKTTPLSDRGWSRMEDDNQNMEKTWDRGSAPSNLYPPDEAAPPSEDYASYDVDYVNPNSFSPGNFSALIYDTNPDSPAIFPNPEMMVYDSEKTGM